MYLRRNKRHHEEKIRTEESHKIQKETYRIETMLKHRDALHQKIEEFKAKHASERKKASPAEKLKIDRKIYEEFLHLNDMDYFYREMDTVLNNLVSKLRTRYPSLTSKEVMWCCLYLLNVPVFDIYLLLDYKVDSLKKMRQRLAHKINLSGVTELDDFLTKMLTEL